MPRPSRSWQTTWRCLVLIGPAVSLLACAGGPKRPERAAANRPELPEGPVASPAGATVSSHVRTEVAPLGSVPYDGQVLPLVSPDGRFLAVQDGEAPSWEALLGTPGAEPPSATRLTVYDLETVPARRIASANPLPLGLLLGRAADSAGFLVESPRPDGARWIGRVSWVGGSIEWLAQGNAVNAHAVLTHSGALLYTRAAVDGGSVALVLRHQDGRESTLADQAASFALPMVSGQPNTIYAVIRGTRTTDLAAIQLSEDDSSPLLGSIVVRRTLASGTDPGLGFQAAAPVQNRPPPVGADPAPLAVYHPKLGRMTLLDPAEGTFLTLAPKSVAAAFWPRAGRRGFFCTTPEGLVFTPLPTAAELSSGRRPPDVRILATPYVPRITAHPARPLILFGPDSRNPLRLQLFAMRLDVPDSNAR